MKKLGFVTALLFVACSSSSKQPKQPEPMADSTEMPSGMGEETAASDETPERAVQSPDNSTAPPGMQGESLEPAPPAEPEPAAPPPAPSVTAHLVSIKDGAAIGTMTFEKKDNMISMAGTFNGLPPGVHALYIHEKGDCTSKGKKIGKHLDPTKAKHGPPSASNRHAGDLGNITADADGNASFQMDTDSVTVDDIGRADTLIHRAVVIHAKKDDARGNGGAPIACGVIEQDGEGADAQQATAPATP